MSFISQLNLNEVAKGDVEGHAIVTVFGRNGDVDAAAEEDLWTAGATLSHLSAADTLDVVSADAADTFLGAGARVVEITYLDASFDLQVADVNMNGVTPVTTPFQAFRVLSARVKQVGTYGAANTGAITITDTGGGSTQALIDAGQGVTQMSHYTIPNAKTGFILNAFPSVESTKVATFFSNRRDDADVVAAPFGALNRGFTEGGASGALPELLFSGPIGLPAKTDFWFSATVTADNTQVHILYQLLLVDDN